MFNNCKYTNWYTAITSRAKNRSVSGYTETHHIIPKSLGGNDSLENLVILTAKEHFICHLLLTKMVNGAHKHKMIKAARMMACASSTGQDRYRIPSRIYEMLRRDVEVPTETRRRMSISQLSRFKTHSGTFKGKSHSDETKEKIRLARLGKKDTAETRARKSKSAKTRPPVSAITREKLSIANKGKANFGEKNGFYGKTHSDEQREKKRQEKLNEPRQTCPHCSKIVDNMNYSRWHGDKCKHK